jgi:hypothetical protein
MSLPVGVFLTQNILHYKAKDKAFVARVHYTEGTRGVVKEEMTIMDDWLIDTYEKDVAKKLMHHEEPEEFIQPSTE